MILINFSHPITDAQRTQIEALASQPIAQIIDVPTHLTAEGAIEDEVIRLVDTIDMDMKAWQSLPILVVPPGFAPAAGCLLAELHGRMGHFPTIVVIRSRPDSPVPVFDATQIINLHALRNRARESRIEQI